MEQPIAIPEKFEREDIGNSSNCTPTQINRGIGEGVGDGGRGQKKYAN